MVSIEIVKRGRWSVLKEKVRSDGSLKCKQIDKTKNANIIL